MRQSSGAGSERVAVAVTSRNERKGENESLFREVNERLERQAIAKPGAGERFRILCECADEECTQRVVVSFAEYGLVRADPRRFIVIPGHVDAEVERVVDSGREHQVVVKFGDAAVAAEEEDPRSDG